MTTQIDKTTKAATAQSVMAKLDDLVIQRQAFQVEYDKVNDTLYGLLAQCLDVYLTTKGGKAEKNVLEAIKSDFAARSIEIGRQPTVLSLIVRYVFIDDKKHTRRINSYVRALSYAMQSGASPATFADYVKSFGGIEEVVSTQGVKPATQVKRDTLKAQVSVVQNELPDAQVLATVAPSHLVKPEETGEYTLLIGKTLLSGETEVLAVVPKATDAMIKQAIAKIADAEIEFQKLQLALLAAQAPVTTATIASVPVVATVIEANVDTEAESANDTTDLDSIAA
jgi:hypothetical protein